MPLFILFFLPKVCFFLLLLMKFYCSSFKDQFRYYLLLKPNFSPLEEFIVLPLHFHSILLKYSLYDNKHKYYIRINVYIYLAFHPPSRLGAL